ncbi:uncharacterized protein LOC112452421 isoform X2 [Temnothorax curvispinosus]|nr:uncharacterized protein LOC112452421 isoform X2 [Temnothorax curvispinosus]
MVRKFNKSFIFILIKRRRYFGTIITINHIKFSYLQLALELNTCNTWDEKVKVFHAYFPKDLNVLTIENQKLIYFTVFNHIVAVQDYDISSLPRLKSSITLLKPTFPIVSFTEEDYGLHKVTEGKVQIHYVEGNHITMMDNDKIISAINEEWIDDNKIKDNIIQ